MSLEALFSDVFSIPAATVTDELALSEIASWDSLTHMMLIVRLEEQYKTQFTGDEIAGMVSVAMVRHALKAHGVQT